MNNTQHTPGPWEWVQGDKPTHRELIASADKGSGEDSILYHGADWPITKTNAELIARAPDLAKELKEAKARIEDLEAWMTGHLAWIKAGVDGDKCHHGRANVMRAELDFIKREMETKLKSL